MLLQTLSDNWARVIFGIYFAVVNSIILKKVFNRANTLPIAIILFFISCPVVTLINDPIRNWIFNTAVKPMLAQTEQWYNIGVFFGYYFLTNSLAFIIPVYIFTKIIKDNWIITTTIYFIYVILDRFAIVVSFSQLSYLVILVLFLGMSPIMMKGTNMEIIARNAKYMEWKPMLHYIIGLYSLLEALFGAYYIIPGAEYGVFNLSKLWIDTIAVISTIFFAAFAKMNLKSSMNQAAKLEYMKKLQENQYDIILKLTEISEAKSGETGKHVKRVSEYSAALAAELGLNDEDVECIRIASMMHDVGKLLVPKEIIEKPGKLEPDEMKIMKEHTTYGQQLLSKSSGEVISMARVISYEHHERWDGTGYPRGISGEAISEFAQIVSVADVYDALTSKRSYKEPWTKEDAKDEIKSQRGRQFSPAVVDAFLRCFSTICQIQDVYIDDSSDESDVDLYHANEDQIAGHSSHSSAH